MSVAERRRTTWGGTLEYRAERLLTPSSTAELPGLIRAHTRLRPLGTRHSFTRLADTTGVQISLQHLPVGPADVVVDRERMTATVPGWATYADLGPLLDRHGVALESLASLPHIGVAGAVATATHGSGLGRRNLSAAVVGLELVDGTGSLVRVTRDDPDLAGYAVHLGALGVVTSLTLSVVPSRPHRQRVYPDLPRRVLAEHLPEILGAGQSVSCFTRWRHDLVEAVLLKSSVDAPAHPDTLHGVPAATAPYHPIRGQDPAAATEQLDRPGPWHERLPHFRADRVPSAGAELQSEWFVDLADAAAALAAMWGVGDRIAPVLMVSEVRTVAADDLWLSPARGRDVLGLHFTWAPEPAAVDDAAAAVEEALAHLRPVPHWGKVAPHLAATWRDDEGVHRFRALSRRHDPDRRWRNELLDDVLDPAPVSPVGPPQR